MVVISDRPETNSFVAADIDPQTLQPIGISKGYATVPIDKQRNKNLNIVLQVWVNNRNGGGIWCETSRVFTGEDYRFAIRSAEDPMYMANRKYLQHEQNQEMEELIKARMKKDYIPPPPKEEENPFI